MFDVLFGIRQHRCSTFLQTKGNIAWHNFFRMKLNAMLAKINTRLIYGCQNSTTAYSHVTLLFYTRLIYRNCSFHWLWETESWQALVYSTWSERAIVGCPLWNIKSDYVNHALACRSIYSRHEPRVADGRKTTSKEVRLPLQCYSLNSFLG
jgi:hypothetical protein